MQFDIFTLSPPSSPIPTPTDLPPQQTSFCSWMKGKLSDERDITSLVFPKVCPFLLSIFITLFCNQISSIIFNGIMGEGSLIGARAP